MSAPATPGVANLTLVAAPWRPVGDDVIGADGRPVLWVSTERPKNRVAIARLAAAAPALAAALAEARGELADELAGFLHDFTADGAVPADANEQAIIDGHAALIGTIDAALSAAGWPLEAPEVAAVERAS